MKYILLLTLFISGFSSSVHAQVTPPLKLTVIGCHTNNNTCYVSIAGDPVGNANCQSTSIRWDVETTPNGERALAMLTSAFYAGKKVQFAIPDYTCHGAHPTFSYFNIFQE